MCDLLFRQGSDFDFAEKSFPIRSSIDNTYVDDEDTAYHEYGSGYPTEIPESAGQCLSDAFETEFFSDKCS